MKTKLLITYLSFLLVIAFMSTTTRAANITWLSPVSGNWSDGTNWSGGVAPGINDTAVINVAGTYTVTLNTSASVAKLLLGGASGKQTISSNSTTMTIANASTIDINGIYYMNYATINGAGLLQNDGLIQLNSYNTISTNLLNTDTIYIDHTGNSMTGNFTTTSPSVVYFRCANYVGNMTWSNGWTNNGKIIMASTSCYYSQMIISAGELLNPVGSIIQSSPNPYCYGYNRIDAAVNNQGTMNIDYSLNIYTSVGASANSGTVSFTSPNQTLTYYNGIVNWNNATLNFNTGSVLAFSSATLNWNGGPTTGTGKFNFESSTGNFNTPVMPAHEMFFNYSTLGSSQPAISNAKKITLNSYNTISASLQNTDTIYIDYTGNSMTGTFTTTSASVVYFRCSNYVGQLTWSNGWTNNGKIIMASTSCYYAQMIVSAGELLNPAGSIIQSSPNPYCYGYNRIDAAVNNQGTMNIDYTLNIYTSIGASANSGTVSFTSPNQTLTYYNGIVNWNNATLNFNTGSILAFSSATLNWNGGPTTGTGKFNFESSTGNFNTPVMPAHEMFFNYSTLGSSQPSISNAKKITLNSYNTISANLQNTDTIYIDHTGNSMTGNFTTASTSVVYFRCANSVGNMTWSNGWTNNGKIIMASTSCYYAQMIISAGVLLNPAGSLIQSSPNPYCYGYNRIDAAVNNQGTMNIDYTLNIYTSAGASTNSGIVSFTSPNQTLTYYNGIVNWNNATINFNTGSVLAFSGATLNWNGGTTTGGTGQFNFESSTGNFTTSSTPNARMYFSSSTLASPMLPLTSSHLIEFNVNNTITAAVFNTDTIRIHSSGNNMTGALTTATNSAIIFDASNNAALLTVSSGFTNNGLIKFASISCYYTNLTVSTGNMINSNTGLIISDPNPYCYGYNRLDAALINQGNIVVNYLLKHYTSVGTSSNTGTITIASGTSLEVYNGTWNWDSGTASGTGMLKFYSATAGFNTAIMPPFETYFSSSNLTSSLGGISSSKKIRLSSSNTISANLHNTDSILVQHSSNTFSGNYTNTSSSLLWFDGVESNSAMSFANGFTNNGKILFQATYYYGNLNITAGVLTNAVTGIIETNPNPYAYGYYQMNAALNNLGAINVNYTLYHYTNPGASHNTGTISIAAGKEYRVYNGTWHWDGGTATGTGLLAFYSATASFNTATMPPFYTYFTSSNLTSSLGGILNSKRIRLGSSNTISANLNNTDSILVQHSSNMFSGNYTNTSSSLLWFDGVESNSTATFANGFTNNGKILFQANYYYGELNVTAGVLTNAASGIIETNPNPYAYGYYQMNAALNNLGTINVNYTLYHYTNAGASHNTGTISIAAGKDYRIYYGTWHWDGGTATGTGLLAFYSATASFNTPAMPPFYTYFTSSNLTSSLGGISNSKRIRLGSSNTISANLNNTDSILVQHSSNTFSGNYSNTASSLLWFDGVESNSTATFANGFTNNGKILFQANYYYGELNVTAGVLNNGVSGIIETNPNPYAYGYYQMNGSLVNDGTIAINYQLYHGSGSFINNSGGLIKGSTYLNNFGNPITNNGTIAPGASPGILQINAKIKNTTTSMWNIEVGGLTAGTQHDQIDNLFGATTDSINGTLNISLINGFIPGLGDSVIIEKHNTRVGTFATITGQAIPGGLYWNVFYRTNSIVLRAGDPPNLDIVSTTGANGTISPLGTTSIVYNGTQTYNMTPNSNYQIDSVFVDGVYAGNNSSYTFNNVIVNHTIHVTFKFITWTITASSGSGGNISPSGTLVVSQGSNSSFNITPDPCFLIDSVYVDGGYIGAPASHTFTNVTANHTIHAVFRTGPKITAGGPLSFCIGGIVTLDAGSGYLAYNWSNGASTQTTIITTGGTYTCTITGAGGCTSSESKIVTVNPLPVVTFSQPYPADNGHVCITAGGLDLSASGLGLPVGGSYSGTGVQCVFSCVFSPVLAGAGSHLITYTYTDVNGCSGSATNSIIVDQNATVDAGPATAVLCNTLVANLNGSIGGSAGSGTWTTSGSGSFNNANALNAIYTLSSADSLAGTVTLTLATNNPTGPCGAVSDQITLYYNPDAIANAGADQCSGATVSVSGTITGYAANPQWTTLGTGTFTNSNAYSTTYNASGADLSAGFVNLVLTPIDPNGNCTFTPDTVKIWFDPQYFVNAGIDQTICNQTLDTIYLFGVTTAVQGVSWSTTGSGTFGNANTAQTYYVLSAADKANGYMILTITSDDPAGPCTSVSESMILKYKFAVVDASVDVCGDTVTNVSSSINTNTYSSSILSYQWTTAGSGTFSAPNLSSGLYNASNSDVANGSVKIYVTAVDLSSECVYNTDSMTIWFNPHYVINAGPDTLTICADALVSLSASSTAPSNTWTSSGNGVFGNASLLTTTYTPSNADTASGQLKLYLTSVDPAGPCSFVRDSLLVIIHSLPNLTAGTNSPVCIGNDLDLTASGGINYSWTGPGGYTSTLQNIIRTPADLSMNGTYTVTANNSYGCTSTASTVALVQNCGCTVPVLSETHINPTCFGSSNGSIDLTIVSGVGVYTFQWSNGATTEDISGLGSGTFICTVSAGVGCTDVIVIQLNQTAISISLAGTNVSSYGNNNGSINTTLSGGTSPYLYNWSNGASTQNISGLIAGTYTVTVTDANSCTATSSIVITQPGNILISGVITNGNSCIGANTGAIDVSVSNGTAPYTYLWNDGTTTEDRINLAAGVYTVTVNDNLFATATLSFTVQLIINSPPVIAVSSSSPAVCPGGSVTLTASGATTYSWSPVSGLNATTGSPVSAYPVTTTTYTVTGTDNNGCTGTGAITITYSTAPIILTAVKSDATLGGNTGTAGITFIPSGSTILWSSGETTNYISNKPAGSYTGAVTSPAGCVKSKTLIIN